jgi:hypothetical protein
MKKILTAGAAMALLISYAAHAGNIEARAFAAEQHAKSVPVQAGGDPDMDFQCSSGTIQVQTFASVRSGPGTQFAEVDRVYNGQKIAMCDERATGPGLKNGWFGVVYGDDLNKCGLNGGQARHDYAGPCRHGWVHKKLTGNWAG